MVKRYKVSNRLVVGYADAFDLQNVHVVLASDHEARCQEINDQWAAENGRLTAALVKSDTQITDLRMKVGMRDDENVHLVKEVQRLELELRLVTAQRNEYHEKYWDNRCTCGMNRASRPTAETKGEQSG